MAESKPKVQTESAEKAVAAETEKGYRGVATDQTPNENYTVKGVTSGKPVPSHAK